MGENKSINSFIYVGCGYLTLGTEIFGRASSHWRNMSDPLGEVSLSYMNIHDGFLYSFGISSISSLIRCKQAEVFFYDYKYIMKKVHWNIYYHLIHVYIIITRLYNKAYAWFLALHSATDFEIESCSIYQTIIVRRLRTHIHLQERCIGNTLFGRKVRFQISPSARFYRKPV